MFGSDALALRFLSLHLSTMNLGNMYDIINQVQKWKPFAGWYKTLEFLKKIRHGHVTKVEFSMKANHRLGRQTLGDDFGDHISP